MILELPGFDHPDLSEFLQGFQKRPNSEFRSQWPKVIVGAGDFFASSFSSRPDRRINHGWLVMEGPGPLFNPPFKGAKKPGIGTWDPIEYPLYKVYMGVDD